MFSRSDDDLVEQAGHMCDERGQHHDREQTMQPARRLESADRVRQPCGPGRIAEIQRQARRRQPHEARHHGEVQAAVEGIEARIHRTLAVGLVTSLPSSARSRVDIVAGRGAPLPAQPPRPRQPEQRMHAEEEKDSSEQQRA